MEHTPYLVMSKKQWSDLRADEPMTLDANDISRLHALNDPISLDEAEQVYLPLTRLMSLYVEAVHQLHAAAKTFLNRNGKRVPYIIGVSGSVAVGKSTTARILHALMQRWPNSPKVDLVTTDGFLFPNAELEARGLMTRKGFPESYDRARFINFLAAIKAGRHDVPAPVYSHLVYDVVPDQHVIVDQPDILIVEGLNILQPGELPKSGRPVVFASDFLDFSIYIHADPRDLRKWFLERFKKLRDTAFRDENSFFHRYCLISESEALEIAEGFWDNINFPNLIENIQPTRGRADLILTKAADHTISQVALRRI